MKKIALLLLLLLLLLFLLVAIRGHVALGSTRPTPSMLLLPLLRTNESPPQLQHCQFIVIFNGKYGISIPLIYPIFFF